MALSNFLQGVNKTINGVFGNTCTLIFSINTFDWHDDTNVINDYPRSLPCDEPVNVDTKLIDNVNYIAGDMIISVDYKSIIDARVLEAGEPADLFTVLRPFDIKTGGYLAGTDKAKISSSGDEYSIVAIEGVDWIGNEPASYQFTLRR